MPVGASLTKQGDAVVRSASQRYVLRASVAILRRVGGVIRRSTSSRRTPGSGSAKGEARLACGPARKAGGVGLDGSWDVVRTGGLLPPLPGVRKRIAGERGATLVGPLRLPFRVDGLTLRYERPLAFLVDELEPDGDGYRGRATLAGRRYGTFALRRRDRVGAAAGAAAPDGRD